MKQILDSLIEKQIRLGFIREEERELYEYGYLIMCEWGFNIVMAALIALITGAVQTTIVFLVSIIPLRSFAGGYHASTPGRCALISNGCLAAVIWFSRIVFCYSLPVGYLFLGEIFLTAVYFVHVPVDTPNKPLSSRERSVYGMIAKCLYVAELAVMAALWKGNPQAAVTILSVHICVVCSLVAANLTKEHTKNVKRKNCPGL